MIDLTSRAVSLKDFNWKHSPGLLQHRKKYCSSSRRRAGGHAGTKYFLASSFYCGLVNTVARSITLSHVTSIPPLTGLPLHILCLHQEWFPSPFSIFVADGINSGQTMMRVQPFHHRRPHSYTTGVWMRNCTCHYLLKSCVRKENFNSQHSSL